MPFFPAPPPPLPPSVDTATATVDTSVYNSWLLCSIFLCCIRKRQKIPVLNCIFNFNQNCDQFLEFVANIIWLCWNVSSTGTAVGETCFFVSCAGLFIHVRVTLDFIISFVAADAMRKMTLNGFSWKRLCDLRFVDTKLETQLAAARSSCPWFVLLLSESVALRTGEWLLLRNRSS